MKKAVGFAGLCVLAFAIGALAFTAFHRSTHSAPKPYTVPQASDIFAHALDAKYAARGVSYAVASTRCAATANGIPVKTTTGTTFGCITKVISTATPPTASGCVLFLFDLPPGAKQPSNVHGQLLTASYCA